jgi:protein SCO1
VKWLVLIIVGLAFAAPASAHELPRDEIVRHVGYTPRLGQRVPLDAAFVDADGQPVQLGEYFGQRPVILSLNYFHCQYVCPIEEDGLISALNGVRLRLGSDFSLVTVSMDPHDGPADAAAIKARALRGYDRPEDSGGWHLLTGPAPSIQRLTESVGFQYLADPVQGDFAHPIGVVILTPDGQISHYENGLDFAAGDLQQSLRAASTDQPQGVFAGALVVCYQFDPLTGRFAPLALNIVRIGGAVGLVVIATWLARLWRADLRGGG